MKIANQITKKGMIIMTDLEKRQLFARATELQYKIDHPQTLGKEELSLLKCDLLRAKSAITLNKLNDEYREAQRIF